MSSTWKLNELKYNLLCVCLQVLGRVYGFVVCAVVVCSFKTFHFLFGYEAICLHSDWMLKQNKHIGSRGLRYELSLLE